MIERALKGARLPPASGARARGEMDAGGLACAAIGTCLRTFFSGRGERAEARNAKRAASAAPARKRGLRSSDEGWPAGRRARVGVDQGVVLERGGSGVAAKRVGGGALPMVARQVSARGQQLGGAKRDYGEGSPSGSSVACMAAVESLAVVSRRESTRSRRALWAEAGSSRG